MCPLHNTRGKATEYRKQQVLELNSNQTYKFNKSKCILGL